MSQPDPFDPTQDPNGVDPNEPDAQPAADDDGDRPVEPSR